MSENIEQLFKEIRSILEKMGKIQNSPCYICQLLKSKQEKTIKAHSISKSSNFKHNDWYGWEYSFKNIYDNYFYNQELINKSSSVLSVTSSICQKHDLIFNDMFENNDKSINYFDSHHLVLLNLRTFINSHLILTKENKYINNILIYLNNNKIKYQLNNLENNFLNKFLEDANNKITVNKKIIESQKFYSILERNVTQFLNKTYIQQYVNNFDINYMQPLHMKITSFIIPLKQETTIVGSFFLDYRDIPNNLTGNIRDICHTLLTTENECFLDKRSLYTIENEINIIKDVLNEFKTIQNNINISFFLKSVKQKYSTKYIHPRSKKTFDEILTFINSIEKLWKKSNNKDTFEIFLLKFQNEKEHILFNKKIKFMEERIFKYKNKLPLIANTKWHHLNSKGKQHYKNNHSVFLEHIRKEYDNTTTAIKLSKYSKEHLISFNILNNKTNPAIIIQCEDSPHANIFLHNLFILSQNNIDDFENFLCNQIITQRNVFFEKMFIDNLDDKSKNNLIKCYSKNNTLITESLLLSIKSQLHINYEDLCFYLQGRPYRTKNYIREEKFSIEINEIKILDENLHDNLVIYIDVTLGNDYRYSFYLESNRNICHRDNENSDLARIQNHCDGIIDFWNGEVNIKTISQQDADINIKTEINDAFNSICGYEYYNYFNSLAVIIKKEIEEKINENGKTTHSELEKHLKIQLKM